MKGKESNKGLGHPEVTEQSNERKERARAREREREREGKNMENSSLVLRYRGTLPVQTYGYGSMWADCQSVAASSHSLR